MVDKPGVSSEIPPILKVARLALRGFAGFWFLMALVLTAMTIWNVVNNPGNPDSWLPLTGAAAVLLPGYLLFKLSDRVLTRFGHGLEQASADGGGEVHRQRVQAGGYRHEYVEVVPQKPAETQLCIDPEGRIRFESTKRPIRLMFIGGFLLVGWLISGLIFAFSDDIGWFEYLFAGGWTLFCLVGMGLVYEVTIDPTGGMVVRRAGWFRFVLRRCFRLSDFSRIVIESTFYRTRHTRHHTENPTFRVHLDGKARVNLKGFGTLAEARHLGEELAGYLGLPLEEQSTISNTLQ